MKDTSHGGVQLSYHTKERKSIMYTKAELFSMAAEQPKEIFVNNITLSVPDDADSCLDLDAEKEKLSSIWDLVHLSMRELVARTGLSQTSFAKRTGIPLRTVQNWCIGTRDCPAYVRFLLAEHYGLI